MNRNRGFTLIELMLVILVMGYLATLVKFPSLAPDPFEQTEKEASRLSYLINLASEYSVIKNVQAGLALTETSYAFLAFDGEKWLKLDEPPFVMHEVAENIRLELKLDGLDWQEQNLLSAVELIDEEALEESSQMPEEEKAFAFPQIFILSSGELSPFDISVIYDDGFDRTVEFLVRGEFIAPVKVFDPAQIRELD